MPHLQTGIEWLDNLHLNGLVPRKTRNLTVTVNGEDRDATWKEGGGVYVDGHDFGNGDTVLIEGTAHEETEMRRMQVHGEAVTLIIGARKWGSWSTPFLEDHSGIAEEKEGQQNLHNDRKWISGSGGCPNQHS